MKSETIYEIMLSVLSEDATEDEHRLLNEWLACSEANRRQFEQVGELYRSFETVGKQDDSEYDVEQAWMRVRNQTVEKKKKFNLKTWLPYAALVAIAFSIGLYFMNRPAEPDWTAEADVLKNINQPTLLLDNGERIPLKQDSFSIQQGNMVIRNNLVGQLSYESDREQPSDEEKLSWNHLVIPKGNAYELELADGTHVWLNAESELSYPTRFAGEMREVRLKGEAFFDVAKNPDCPFVVRTDEVAVQVLGTSFNVSAYQSEQMARVYNPYPGLTAFLIITELLGGDNPEFFATIRFYSHRTSYQCDTDLYTSWVKGEYIFKDAALEEIFNKLLHWYDFTVRYQNEQLKDKRFSLVIDRKISLEQLLELISFTSDVKLERSQGNIIYVKQKREEV